MRVILFWIVVKDSLQLSEAMECILGDEVIKGLRVLSLSRIQLDIYLIEA